jgi:hypothetical protein
MGALSACPFFKTARVVGFEVATLHPKFQAVLNFLATQKKSHIANNLAL